MTAILDLAMGAILNLKPVNNIIWEQMCLLYVIMPVSIDYFEQINDINADLMPL